MKFNFYLAKRFLFGHAHNTWRSSILMTALSGIFFASTFVLVSVGIMAGFQNAYRSAVLNFNSHLIITAAQGLSQGDQDVVMELLASNQNQTPNIASPYLFYETLMPTKQGMRPVVLKGVDVKVRNNLYPFVFAPQALSRPSGTLPPEGEGQGEGPNEIYIGSGILDLQPDIARSGKLKLVTVKNKNGAALTHLETLPVSGTFSSGLYHFDSQFVFMDLQELRHKYFYDEQVNGIEVRLKNSDQIQILANELRQKLPPEFEVTTWDELNNSLLEALKLEKSAFSLVAFLILLIACLNIFGFSFLFFLQRKQEFLILSLLGLPQAELRKLLRLLSVTIGAVATVFAAIFSYGILAYLYYGPGIKLDPDVYFVTRVPVFFEWFWFVAFMIGTWILCLATSWVAGRVVVKRYL